MADYWDTSQDDYSKSSPREEVQDKPPAAMEIDNLRSSKAQMPAPPSPQSSGTVPDPLSRTQETPPPPLPASAPVAEETYTGRRTKTGRNMPAKYREDTIFTFVEPLTWCFRCRLEHARQQPRLKMSGMIMPLPHNANIYRSPRDSRQARRGILEGPLAGVYCRDTVVFRRPEDGLGEGKQEIMDLLREVGLGLMLAQKRARDGKQEEGVQEEQWWAHKPRWGGGQGGEVGIEEEETVEELATGDHGGGQPRKKSRKMNRAALWREVRPPTTMWEKGVKYLRIGKERATQYDDIYLLSSVMHHISIIHLRIPNQYTENLPKQPPRRRRKGVSISNPQQQPWHRLEMRRSRWYDLLIADDRIEAMRGIWAVMGCLMRNISDEGDEAK